MHGRLRMGSWETSVRLMRGISFVVSIGASQSSGELSSRGVRSQSSCLDDGVLGRAESSARVSSVVWGCEPVSTTIRTRPGAL